MNRRRFLALLFVGGPATAVAQQLGLWDRLKQWLAKPAPVPSLFAKDSSFWKFYREEVPIARIVSGEPVLITPVGFRNPVQWTPLADLTYESLDGNAGTMYRITRNVIDVPIEEARRKFPKPLFL